jgi:glycosyltransferase involved in cell wall biosynthesis
MYLIASMGDALAGTERNLLTIISHLDRTLFEPHLVSLQDCPFIRHGDYVCPTFCLDLCRMFTPRMWNKRRELAKRMRDLGIDVVQTFTTDAHLVGEGAARKAGVRAIISSRRDLGDAYNAKERFYLKVANRYPHRFLANSLAVANSIAKLEGIDRARLDVIYNGVEIPPTDGLPRQDSASVVMVANLRPVKSVSTLIQAAGQVVKAVTEAKFILVGDGPERGALESMVAQSGLRETFHFVGRQPDVSPFIRSASVGVLTSVSEGFSNAILEYMCAGLPVVATRVGGNPEIVEDGESGFLVPVCDPASLAEKLICLLQNHDLAARMGLRARERVEREFSLDAMICRHQDYYQKLLLHTNRTT